MIKENPNNENEIFISFDLKNPNWIEAKEALKERIKWPQLRYDGELKVWVASNTPENRAAIEAIVRRYFCNGELFTFN